jgi:hypothetical protein
MTGGIVRSAEVVSFTPLGWRDLYDGGVERHDLVVLRPIDADGSTKDELRLVLDDDVSGGELLHEVGAIVALELDPEVLDLDVIFAGGVIGTVQRVGGPS